jgi:uncharacterized damage-inducible protein DinB
MNWTQLLTAELDYLYRVTEQLFEKVDDERLDWKPDAGENWMTTGQLLMHTATSNGPGFKGFVSGDWGMPDGVSLEDMEPDEMLPAAEKMPTVESVAQARELLARDRQQAFEVLQSVSEDDLANRELAAPWNPGDSFALGRHLLHSIRHSIQHKGQLFYYLKLQGKPVNTADLWGM